jgi:hypothetical protein
MKNYTDSRPPFIKLNKKGEPKNIPNPPKRKKKKDEQ